MPDENDPSDVPSPNVCEKPPEADKHIKEAGKDQIPTEGKKDEVHLSHLAGGRVLRGVGSMTLGVDFAYSSLNSILCNEKEGVRETPATLSEENIEIPVSEPDEDIGDTLPQLKLNLAEWVDEESCAELGPDINFHELLEKMDSNDEEFMPETPKIDVQLEESAVDEITTSPSKTGANIDLESLPIPGEVNPEEYNKQEGRELSDFEKECFRWKEISDIKPSDRLAKAEESYLSQSHEKVTRLKIFNPRYNLISKDYEPQLGVVDKSYRIVVDVSKFDPENIVVHVANDMINVYAREECESAEGYEFAELHKVYKIPEPVNMDRLEAHMLNPLKLLCICAPFKSPV